MEEIQAGPILPMRLLHTGLVRWHSGAPDAVIGCSYQVDGPPTLNLAAHPQEGLIPFS